MRKPNVEIKKVNLAKAELQLTAYANQYQAIKLKLDEVGTKFEAKRQQVEQLKAELSQIDTPVTTVE